MDKHALAILNGAGRWNWPVLPGFRDSDQQEKVKQRDIFKDASRNLLSGFIVESQSLGGTLCDQFWSAMGKCHPRLMENVEELKSMASFLDESELESSLYDGVDQDEVNFGPVFELAAELFTHLGIDFMNPNEHKHLPAGVDSGGVEEEERQECLKLLILKRDGTSCPVTGMPFFGHEGFTPVLTHVVPASFYDEDTLDCIVIFAGDEARKLILQHTHGAGNVFNMEDGAATAYQRGEWGIDASVDDEGEVKYIFRSVPDDELGYHSSSLRDGDAIVFGGGPDGHGLEQGPIPFFCNLHLAVARVLNTSGAAEVISQLISDADDTTAPHASHDKDFGDILNAKLIISGRAVIL